MKKYSTKCKITISIIFLSIVAVLFIGLIKFNSTSENSTSEDSTSENSTTQKLHITRSVDWAYYSFEQATNTAATILHGKVISKSDTKTYEYIDSIGKEGIEFYKEVTIEVIDALKGNISENTITYIEMSDGETDDYIFTIDGLKDILIDPGSEYIFFLNENGSMISPGCILHVSDGNVIIKYSPMLPKSYTPTDPNSKSIDIETYVNAIKDAVKYLPVE